MIAEGATDPGAWGEFFGRLGPGGFALVCLGVIVLLVVAFVGFATVALTGIPRFKIPGLAWVIAGVWQELHGFRQDLRAWQRGEDLPDLGPISESAPPPPVTRRAPVAQKNERDEPRPSRPTTRQKR